MKNREERFNREVNNITVQEAYELLNLKPEMLILDVSLEEDFEKGHISNAVSMPYKGIRDSISEIYEYKEKDILVYCRTGRGSMVAVTVLVLKGFKNIYHMYQGFASWGYENFMVKQCKDTSIEG